MRKLLSLIFAVTAIVAGARQVSPDEAAAIASEFLNSQSIQRAPGRVTVQRAKPANHQADAPFYVFNADDNHGFVIISGDDRARKVLGYSDTGAFDFNNLPPQLAAMLEQYAKQIEALPASASTDPSWSAPSAAPAST
ncbi:MAG: Spi family protease inhibitor, partial [Muribaculaceae bacterium]|nr:Spi family protease inhibitor [Muribaculaceae bacterium]